MVGGSRRLLLVAAVGTLLLVPAMPASAEECEGFDCVDALVYEIQQGFVAPFQGSLDMITDFAEDADVVVPGGETDGAGLRMAGQGSSTVTRVGATSPCTGTPQIVIEAGKKAFGAEPTVSFSYGGGGNADPRVAPACAVGRYDQATRDMVAGDFDGAWSATKSVFGQTWVLTVSAPANGQRTVHFDLWSDDGLTADTFDGTVTSFL